VKYALILLFLLLPATVAPAAESSVEDPVTYLGEHMLRKTDVVLLGEAGAPALLPTGARLVRVRVTEVLAGTETGKSVLLVAGSPDLLPPKGTWAMLFLKRLGRGRYEPVGLVDATGRDARVRISTLRRYLEIEIMRGAAEKRNALRDFLLTNLESENRFLRWSAARELANFTKQSGKYLRAPHLARIRAVRARRDQDSFRELLDTALARTGARAAPVPKDRKQGLKGPEGPEFRELRRLIQRWKKPPEKAEERIAILQRVTSIWLRNSAPILIDALDDTDAKIRRMAALKLAEGEFTAAEPPLRNRLSEERDRQVLAALIHSLGILKSERALPTSLMLGKSADLRRAAAFAAARTGGKLASDWLDALVASHNRETVEDREIRRLVTFLRSDAFKRQEKALAEIRKRRLR